MYLRTLKAARSAKFFWEEFFMPKSQLGGILYIFPPGQTPHATLRLLRSAKEKDYSELDRVLQAEPS